MGSANHRPNRTVRVGRLGPQQPSDATHPCAGCRTELPPQAVFCVECGLCQLGMTHAGTVIAESPYVAQQYVDRADSGRIELDDFDMLIEWDEEFEATVQAEPYFAPSSPGGTPPRPPELLWRRRREVTAVSRGPARPSPYWDAPPKGLTVVVPAVPEELRP